MDPTIAEAAVRRIRSSALKDEKFEEDAGGDEYEQQVIKPKEINQQTQILMDAVAWATD